jgi:hypothetical protein
MSAVGVEEPVFNPEEEMLAEISEQTSPIINLKSLYHGS